jgi:hypothetical protein
MHEMNALELSRLAQLFQTEESQAWITEAVLKDQDRIRQELERDGFAVVRANGQEITIRLEAELVGQ